MMPKPDSFEEAIARAPVLSEPVVVARISKAGIDELAGISSQAADEFNSLLYTAADDLTGVKQIQVGCIADDSAVLKVSSMISSLGLAKLAALKQALSRLSDKDEEVNARRTQQLLAWLKHGKDAKDFDNRLLVFASQVEMIPTAIERSLRTPMSEWGSEIGELFKTGGGFTQLSEVFSGTPAEGIVDVVVSSLTVYLKLREQAKHMGRLKEDMQLQAVCYNRKTEVAARIGRQDLDAYRKAEQTYRSFQTKLEQLQSQKGTEESGEYYKELERVTRANERALANYQSLNARVKMNPATVENSLANLLQSLQTAESFGDNELRLYQLSAQFRQNALLRVNQLILVLSALSSAYCKQISAKNRAMQENIINDCKRILEFAASGEFQNYLEPEECKELLAVNE